MFSPGGWNRSILGSLPFVAPIGAKRYIPPYKDITPYRYPEGQMWSPGGWNLCILGFSLPQTSFAFGKHDILKGFDSQHRWKHSAPRGGVG